MLDDKYRIERLLAIGGMGAVYVGTHTTLRKRVAIKILNPAHSTGPMIERFRREAILASQIGHEGIAQVTDLGTSSEGEPFLVMEYLEGESLASRLQTAGTLSVEDACEIGCAILSPLGAAHRAGIVHRDLKPDNVFLVRQSRGETLKLLDFGISRVSGLDPEFRLTMTGLVLGTPFYMSPEQARGESEVTTAADIYAFGVMLYEMLVGEVPIRAENYNQLMYRVTMSDFRPPRVRRPTLPPDLEAIILQAMAQDPGERPASTIELEHALLPFCRPAFREQASGRISSGLLRASPWSITQAAAQVTPGPQIPPSRVGIDRLDYAMFEGSTIPDSFADAVRPPDDADQPTAVVATVEPPPDADGLDDLRDATDAALGSQTELPASTAHDDPSRPALPAARRRPRARSVMAIAVVGVVFAGAVVIALADRDPDAMLSPAPAHAAQAGPAPEKHATVDLALGSSAGSTDGSGDGSASGAAGGSASGAAPPVHPAAVNPLPSAGSEAPREAATVTLRLAIEPRGAAILLDGARVSGPEIVVPRDSASHRLRITAAGYVGYDEAIRFDESQRLVVQLRPQARGKEQRKPPTTERPDRPDRIESRSPYE